LDYFVLTTPAKNIFKQIPDAGDVVVSMYAFNNNEESEPDIRYYNITETSLSAITDAPTSEVTSMPTASPTTAEATTPDAPTGSTTSPAATDTSKPPISTPDDGSPTAAPATVFTDYDSEAMPANASSSSTDTNIFDHSDGSADLENGTPNTTITSPSASPTVGVSSNGGQIQQDEAIAVDDNQEPNGTDTATAMASRADVTEVVGAFLFSLFSFLGLLV